MVKKEKKLSKEDILINNIVESVRAYDLAFYADESKNAIGNIARASKEVKESKEKLLKYINKLKNKKVTA